MLDLYFASLEALGIDTKMHDVRLVEDDWEQPTLGAWGLGWEVWCDGMEVTQFTYFQQVGGERDRARACWRSPTAWNGWRCSCRASGRRSSSSGPGESAGATSIARASAVVGLQLRVAPVGILTSRFDQHETECRMLLDHELPLPAYDQVLKCSTPSTCWTRAAPSR